MVQGFNLKQKALAVKNKLKRRSVVAGETPHVVGVDKQTATATTARQHDQDGGSVLRTPSVRSLASSKYSRVSLWKSSGSSGRRDRCGTDDEAGDGLVVVSDEAIAGGNETATAVVGAETAPATPATPVAERRLLRLFGGAGEERPTSPPTSPVLLRSRSHSISRGARGREGANQGKREGETTKRKTDSPVANGSSREKQRGQARDEGAESSASSSHSSSKKNTPPSPSPSPDRQIDIAAAAAAAGTAAAFPDGSDNNSSQLPPLPTSLPPPLPPTEPPQRPSFSPPQRQNPTAPTVASRLFPLVPETSPAPGHLPTPIPNPTTPLPAPSANPPPPPASPISALTPPTSQQAPKSSFPPPPPPPLHVATSGPFFQPIRYDSLRRHRSGRSASVASQYADSHLSRRPSQIVRRQSLLPQSDSKFITELYFGQPTLAEEVDSDGVLRTGQQPPAMTTRKVWVKRCNASPTSVVVTEEDLVDDVRDMILGKYQNTLGRYWDAPDVQIRIVPRGARPRGHERGHERNHERGHGSERILSPDEPLLRVVEEYYPGGQFADDALIIEVPERKTPRPSPGPTMHSYTYGTEHHVEPGYFDIPPRPAINRGTPDPTNGGRVAPIPSPQYREPHRPIGRRMATSPPVQGIILAPKPAVGRARGGSDASAPNGGQPPPAPPLKTAPSEEDRPQNPSMSTPARVASPLPMGARKKVSDAKQTNPAPSAAPGGAGRRSDGTVPPIKVLIVEDNVINLRLLEAFMKRLKVRWEAAVNGKIAVDKWKAGGFHLVLMDIQLPVMNGLDATKEIRRLEKVNRIRAAFPHTKQDDEDDEPVPEEIPEEDRLPESILFGSPVIIVALTASSLQSDRHEAYAAGCNDFLTKPVNFIWLERKVTEWGCMQALIDFDGWKTWKKNAEEMSAADATVAKNKRQAAGNKTKKLKNADDSPKPTPTVV